jgi:hypothetical protein
MKDKDERGNGITILTRDQIEYRRREGSGTREKIEKQENGRGKREKREDMREKI